MYKRWSNKKDHHIILVFYNIILHKLVQHCSVLTAHNGFTFNFPFLVAEVKRRKLDAILAPMKLYYADTFYDIKRVSIAVNG